MLTQAACASLPSPDPDAQWSTSFKDRLYLWAFDYHSGPIGCMTSLFGEVVRLLQLFALDVLRSSEPSMRGCSSSLLGCLPLLILLTVLIVSRSVHFLDRECQCTLKSTTVSAFPSLLSYTDSHSVFCSALRASGHLHEAHQDAETRAGFRWGKSPLDGF